MPFLGRGVVDYTCSLPGKVKYPKHGLPKHLLRKAMAGQIPDAVFSRAKKGFSLPFDKWIFGPLREQSESAIAALADAPFFEATAVRKIWSDRCAHPGQAHWSRPLSLIVLGSYLQAVRSWRYNDTRSSVPHL